MTKAKPLKGSTALLIETARNLARAQGIHRIVILLRKAISMDHFRDIPSSQSVLLVLDAKSKMIPVMEGIDTMTVDLPDTSPMEGLELSLQKALKLGKVKRGEPLLCLYSLSSPSELDSMSVIRLKEKTEYISFQKLEKLSDTIPAAVLAAVLDIAMQLAREGREGKPIGSLFTVGDSQMVMEYSRPMILNPFQGYGEDQRRITDHNLIETVKEIAQIDGAFVIRYDGMILSAGRYIDTSAKGIRLPKGLGARHMAAASISKATEAVAFAVSASTRTVRVFRKGKIVMESKPLKGLWI